MSDEASEELAALFALGLLDDQARTELESRLAGDPDLAELVYGLNEVTAELVTRLLPEQPSPRVKQAVLRQIAPAPLLPAWILPWSVAAMLTVSTATLLWDRFELRKQMQQLEVRESLAQLELLALKATGEGPQQASAVVAWDERSQSGLIEVSNLPAASPSRDYQLWVIDPASKQPIDAGVLRITGKESAEIRFRPSRPVGKAANFAVSLEKAGGVPEVQGPILMIGP